MTAFPAGDRRHGTSSGIGGHPDRRAIGATAQNAILVLAHLRHGVRKPDAAGDDERQRAEEALIHERYRLYKLMDNLPDSIYFKDAICRFIRINKALASSFGLDDPAQAVAKTDFDYFSREHAQVA